MLGFRGLGFTSADGSSRTGSLADSKGKAQNAEIHDKV